MVVGVNEASAPGLQVQGPPENDVPDPVREALEAARGARLDRRALEALSRRLADLPVADVDAAIDAAVAAYEFEAAAALLLAGAALGRRFDAARIAPVLPYVDDLTLEALVAASTGDRVGVLLEAAATGRLDAPTSALALMVATALLDGAAPPPRLLAELRLLAREPLDEEAGDMVATCALALKDAALREVAGPWIDALERAGVQPFDLTVLRRRADGDPLAILPEDEAAEVVEGDGAPLKAQQKIGRNDPCPCGSGKKFKKCCDGKKPAAPAPPAQGADGDGATPAPGAPLTPKELVALDPAALSEEELPKRYDECVELGLWAPAARLVEELVARARSSPEAVPQPDAWRMDLVAAALQADAPDVAREQLARVAPELRDSPWGRLMEELVAPGPHALERLEAAAVEALRGGEHGNDATHLAVRVLLRYPALGALLARAAFAAGSLDELPERAWLLDEVERARDRLLLPPGDPYQDLFAAVLRDHDARKKAAEDAKERRKQQKHRARRPAGEDEPEADAETLRERLREAATRASELEEELKRLRARERDERRAARERAPAGDAAKVARLREKVDELKALLAESQEEKRELRRELEAARARDDDEARAKAAKAAEPERGEDDDDDEGPAAEAPDERRPALVPVFSDAAAAAIREADRALGRAALRVVSGVAGGDPQVWSQVKRLRRRTDVCSARVGIHYRLLFRMHPARGELEVVSFINRRELDATIRRLG